MENTRREEAHENITWLINEKLYSKTEAAQLLNMSRVTFYSRLKNKDWRAKDIDRISDITPF